MVVGDGRDRQESWVTRVVLLAFISQGDELRNFLSSEVWCRSQRLMGRVCLHNGTRAREFGIRKRSHVATHDVPRFEIEYHYRDTR
jgi:hypothetical protein